MLNSCGWLMSLDSIDRVSIEKDAATDYTNDIDSIMDSGIYIPEYKQQRCWKRKYLCSYIPPLSELDSLTIMSREERLSPLNDQIDTYCDVADTELGSRQRRRLSSPSRSSFVSSSAATVVVDNKASVSNEGKQGEQRDDADPAVLFLKAMLLDDYMSSTDDGKELDILEYSRRFTKLQRRSVIHKLRKTSHRPKGLSKKLLCRLDAMS